MEYSEPVNAEVHIEELVLEGFAQGDPSQIRDAVGRELVRLLREQGVPSSLSRCREAARLDGGAFQTESGVSAEAVGKQVALTVYGGLRKWV